jgi:peptide/nickel transport system permease protein
MLVLLIVVSIGAFLLLSLAPGNPVDILLGSESITASPQRIAELKREFHLNDSLVVQYFKWASGAVRLDFGRSVRSGQPVTDTIKSHAIVTLELATFAFVILMVAGTCFGALAALLHRSPLDRGVVGFSVVGASTPAFVIGVLLLYVFGVRLGWFPVYGVGSGFTDRFRHLVLPAIALAFTGMALVVRLVRAGMISTLQQDHLTFARARGVNSRTLILSYAFRNTLIAIVTAGGLVLADLLTGAVLTEVIFSLPGLGNLLITSVNAEDIQTVQALVLLIAAAIVVVNLVVDVLYFVVDPRIRAEGARK